MESTDINFYTGSGEPIIDVLREISEKTGYQINIESGEDTVIDVFIEEGEPNKIFIRSNTISKDPICRIKYPHSCSICDLNEVTTVPSLPHELIITSLTEV